MPAVEDGADVNEGWTSPPELGTTLNVRFEPDSVVFELHVTNVTTGSLGARFPTAQRYDFEVRTPGGELAWRWSDEHMFAQVLGEEVLAPGESREYRATWAPGRLAGEHVAIGRYTSSNVPVELRTLVHIPGR
jgi:hypothetical protein